jgi:TRAP-type C4-dicarboxylate transport system permease small subunit
MLETYAAILNRIKRAETVLAVLLFGFITAVIAAQIVMRFVFGKPLSWAEESASLSLIYLTFLTADIIYKDKAHISIDFLVKFFPPKLRAAVALAVYALIGIFLARLIPVCIALFKMQFGHITAAVLTLPKSFWSLPVPIAFGSMLLTTGYFISEEIANLLKPSKG